MDMCYAWTKKGSFMASKMKK